MTANLVRCNGVKPDGKPCQATRMSNFAKRSHLVTAEPWFCHRHKDQATSEQSSGTAPGRCGVSITYPARALSVEVRCQTCDVLLRIHHVNLGGRSWWASVNECGCGDAG